MRKFRAIAVIGVAAVTVAVLFVVVSRANRHQPRHPAAGPIGAAVTTTTQPAPPGTQILTEAVDPARIAVPAGWQSLATDVRTLPASLRAFEHGHPLLAGVLKIEEQAAEQGGVRLFAVTTTRPMTFVSVVSYATPGVPVLDPRTVAEYPHVVNRSKGTVFESRAVQLPAGGAFQASTATSTKNVHVTAQYDVVVIKGRTIQIHLATEQGTVPPLFAEIENSLQVG